MSALVVAATVASGACAFEHSSEILSPTPPGGGSVTGGGGGPWAGLWASDFPSNPTSWTCGAFQWDITEQTPTAIAGTFWALCAGVVTVEGQGAGQLNGNLATLSVSGQASIAGVTVTCPFSLNGTGVLQGENEIQVVYTGSTCFGPVQGTEVLRRPSSGSAPPPQQPPTPPPPPTPEVTSSNVNHVGPGPLNGDRAFAIVEATSAEFPHLAAPHPTESSAVADAEQLLLRIIWHLQLAGFNAGRQQNPNGAISNDKLTVFLDGRWQAFDVFASYGVPNQQMHVIFWPVDPPGHIPYPGIPD